MKSVKCSDFEFDSQRVLDLDSFKNSMIKEIIFFHPSNYMLISFFQLKEK